MISIFIFEIVDNTIYINSNQMIAIFQVEGSGLRDEK